MSLEDKAAWLEVSLTVSQDQVDAVAEVLGRFTRDGVVIEQILDDEKKEPHVSASGALKVFGYLFADKTLEDKKLQLEESMWHLSQIQPLSALAYRTIHDQDWMSLWKKHYRPLKIGEKFTILPAWAKNTSHSRTPIRINPGMAFGTGTHPTTRLCLILIEKYLQPGKTMFDIGCGSGILSIASAKLGAKRVYAVDTSPAAIASCAQNAELNQVRERIDLVQGSVSNIISGCFQINRAQLVVVNILSSVILQLFDDGLVNLVEPGGWIILSGILSEQVSEISTKLEIVCLNIEEDLVIDDWVALCIQGKRS